MDARVIYFVLLFILSLGFAWERVLEYLNMKQMSPVLPESLKGIYEEGEYQRFQNYKRENNRLDGWSSTFGFLLMMGFLAAGGFGWYNDWVVSLTGNTILQTLLFVMGLSFVSSLLDIPFDYYTTFSIEERYGFNKTTRATYWWDIIKGAFVSLVLGGVLLSLLVWFYTWAGEFFWLYGWGAVTLFSLFMSLFYSRLIVPLFNKQTPLEVGSLRDKIEAFAAEAGFALGAIYVIDGSKRSTKANAYFTGFGSQKRVVLYDTLIRELSEEEVVAVLAHEIGHYKKHHTWKGMAVSVVQVGVLLWFFSLCVNYPGLSMALGGEQAYFQLGLVAFAILYAPISALMGVVMNRWSRKNEYEADAYAATHGCGEYLVSGLKKISVRALGNLTPHPLYEYVNYSHPSLLKRINRIVNRKL